MIRIEIGVQFYMKHRAFCKEKKKKKGQLTYEVAKITTKRDVSRSIYTRLRSGVNRTLSF